MSRFQKVEPPEFVNTGWLKDKTGEETRHGREPEVARGRGKLGIAQPEQKRSKRQENTQAPPNADAKGRADEKNPADQNKSDPCPEKNESQHAMLLSTRSANHCQT